MKKILILLFIGVIYLGTAQVKPALSTKTIIASYTKAGQWGEWSGLIFETSDHSEIRFLNQTVNGLALRKFWDSELVVNDSNDVSAEIHTVNSNVGQKYKIIYAVKKVKYKGYDADGEHTNAENVIVSFEQADVEDFSAATAKVYKEGELKAVVLNGIIYELNHKGKKDRGQAIQNKNEMCKGDKCGRLFIEPDGSIYSYQLPNTTDKILWGQLKGNEILKYERPYGSGKGGYESKGVTYSGDKQQAAMAVVLHQWFR